MATRSRLTPVALLLAAACSSSPSLIDCASDADCGVGNLCFHASCVTNGAPSADFPPPQGATAHRLFTLVPTTSDPEERKVEARWSVYPVDGGCDPDVDQEDGNAVAVVVWCAGRYEARVVPVDDAGLEGAPTSHAFEVAAAPGAPVVEAGDTIAATHACDLAGPSCIVRGPDGAPSLQLTAIATDPGGAELAYEWVARAPASLAGSAAPRVTFLSGALLPNPMVSIANASGGPIAGVYRFRVRARNPDGLIGQAFQEVVVGNAAPLASPVAWSLSHVYEDGRYVAEGAVNAGVIDPDGDALVLAAALLPPPPDDCTEEVTADPSAGLLHVRIDCAEATSLIGPASRTLELTAQDANGAAVAVSAPLAVQNRAPEIGVDPAFADGAVAVDHRVAPCQLAQGAACFVADGSDPFQVIDPDGDPVAGYSLDAAVAPDRADSAGTVVLENGSLRFRFETPSGLPLQFRSASGASGFSVTAVASDPWGAEGSRAESVVVRNRAPIVKQVRPSSTAPHVYDATKLSYVATVDGALFEDPDGDPLGPSVVPAGSCTSATLDAGRARIACSAYHPWALPIAPPLEPFLVGGSVLVSAGDGWESVGSSTIVALADAVTTVSGSPVTVDRCACLDDPFLFGTPRWAANPAGVPVPALLADADGDPALLTPHVGGAPSQPLPRSFLPGSCLPSVNGPENPLARATVAFDVRLEADSGAPGPHPEAVIAVTVTCSKSGFCSP